jgi:hypothetical protein
MCILIIRGSTLVIIALLLLTRSPGLFLAGAFLVKTKMVKVRGSGISNKRWQLSGTASPIHMMARERGLQEGQI